MGIMSSLSFYLRFSWKVFFFVGLSSTLDLPLHGNSIIITHGSVPRDNLILVESYSRICLDEIEIDLVAEKLANIVHTIPSHLLAVLINILEG